MIKNIFFALLISNLLFDLTYSEEECPPIGSDAVKVQKTGQKAWDKCIDIVNLIQPCVSGENGIKHRINSCTIGKSSTIETDAIDDFPHLGLLGYEQVTNNVKEIVWDCGGILISERWVLTAGHCTYNIHTDPAVKYIKFKNNADAKYLYEPEEVVAHPNFDFISVYNDIALIKLNRDVDFTTAVFPACLYVGNTLNDTELIEASWIDSGDKQYLIKEVVEILKAEECYKVFKPSRKSLDGVKNDTQYCAISDEAYVKDRLSTYGGVVQYYNKDVNCTYTVMGIPSFFRRKGPILYTRVSAFIPWIESHVWP